MTSDKVKEKKTIKRLRSMQDLRAMVDESYRKSVEAMAAGKPTAWAMANFYEADPVMRAMDLEVVYPENFGTICAATGAAEQYLQRSDAEGFPAHMCGYARNCLGYTAMMMEDCGGDIPPDAPMGGMPRPRLLLSTSTSCDARYKWFQSLGRYLDAPQVTLDHPSPGVKEMMGHEGAYENAVELVTVELREFVAFLEGLLGKKMDWDRLAEVVDDMVEICRVWHEANELRKVRPCPMNARDFWSAMPPAFFLMGDLKHTLQLYQALYDEVKERIDQGICAIDDEKYRLMFIELPPWHSLGFFDDLAGRGWNVVCESNSYHPPIPLDLSGVSDPLEKIARFSLQWVVGVYPDSYADKEPLSPATGVLRWAEDYRCDGVLLHYLRTCRAASFHLAYSQEMLLEKLKIPSMVVEGDIVDLRLFNPRETLQRADAFEDTMDHYRELRKEEGRDW